jgi:hypothetical protein
MKGLLCFRSLQLSLCLLFITAVTTFAQQTTFYCPVYQQDYATGSCNATFKTQASLIKAYCNNGERGWAKFDLSSVPDSISITSIKLHFYITSQNYPYYLITKLNADPVTAAAPNLFATIGQAAPTNSNPHTYLWWTGQSNTGWQIQTLNNYARNDLLSSLNQGWFALGFYEYETSGNYYLNVNGWNENFAPYLEVDCSPLYYNYDLALTEIISPSDNTCNGTVPVQAMIYNNGLDTVYTATLTVTRYNQVLLTYNYTSQQGLIHGDSDTVSLGNIVFPSGYNQISITVSNPNGNSDPNFANNSLTQYFSVFEAGSISQQPQDQNALIGATVHFSTQVLIDSWRDFQWQVSTDAGLTFSNLMNGYPYYYVDSSQLTIHQVQSGMNGYLFRCIITAPCDTLTTDPALLTVNQGPVTLFNVTATPDSICVNDTSQLNAFITGGTGNYVFTWTSIPPGFSSNLQNPIVFPSQTTQYICIVNDGTSSDTASCWVIVSQPILQIGPVTGPTSVCKKQTGIVFSIPEVPGGDYYWWTTPNGFSITENGNSITVTVGNYALSGMFTVKVWNYCGWSPASSIHVMVNPSPTVNAGPDQTINAGSSAILYATASGGTSPYTYTWNNGMTGPGIVVTPLVTTTYEVTVIDNKGCTSSDNVTIHVNQPTQITTTLGSVNLCSGNIVVPVTVTNFYGVASVSLTIIYDTNKLQFNGYQGVNNNLTGGAFLLNASGNNIHIAWFSVTPANIGSGTLLQLLFLADTGSYAMNWDLVTQGACMYTDINNNVIPAVFNDNTLTILPCSNVEGYVYYDNNLHSPMSSTPVCLLQSGNITYQTLTDSTGHYLFTDLDNGSYQVKAFPDKPWGSVNASDALLILKHFVNMVTLTGITYHAGDVDQSNSLNSVDALMVAKRFVNMISTFPAGDWVAESKTVTINGMGNIFDSLAVLCTGDVDRSYMPAAGKTAPSVSLECKGEIPVLNHGTIKVPFYVEQALEVNSMSLVMDFQSDYLSFKDIEVSGEGIKLIGYDGKQIKMAWYSLTPLSLQAGKELFNLVCDVTQAMGNFNVNADKDFEIKDFDGNLFSDLKLSYKIPVLLNESISVGPCAPNPMDDYTDISYYISEGGLVQISICNITGQCILTLMDEVKEAGNHSVRWNSADMAPGLYLCNMKVVRENVIYSKYIKMLKK